MIVGIAGPAGSGKSLLATALSERHGFRIISIADLPKRFVKDALNFTDHQLYGPSEARSEPHPTVRRADGQPLTARHALQGLADWAMAACPGVWIEHAIRRAEGCDAVFPDVRYRHELAAIKQVGGIIIRRRLPGPQRDLHASECDLMGVPDSEFAAVIDRYEDKTQLFALVDVLVAGWRSEAAE